MKAVKILVLLVFISTSLFGQHNSFVDSKGFNSVFQNEISGKFTGTVNGVLIIKDLNGKERLLDFQGSKAVLKIEKDKDEVYDSSKKIYEGETTSGKTKVKYSTYALAHEIGIQLNGKWFGDSSIDGGCDLVIDGIEYLYKTEKSTEYLILKITKEIVLSTKHSKGKSSQSIKLLPNSVLIFAINRS